MTTIVEASAAPICRLSYAVVCARHIIGKRGSIIPCAKVTNTTKVSIVTDSYSACAVKVYPSPCGIKSSTACVLKRIYFDCTHAAISHALRNVLSDGT